MNEPCRRPDIQRNIRPKCRGQRRSAQAGRWRERAFALVEPLLAQIGKEFRFVRLCERTVEDDKFADAPLPASALSESRPAVFHGSAKLHAVDMQRLERAVPRRVPGHCGDIVVRKFRREQLPVGPHAVDGQADVAVGIAPGQVDEIGIRRLCLPGHCVRESPRVIAVERTVDVAILVVVRVQERSVRALVVVCVV